MKKNAHIATASEAFRAIGYDGTLAKSFSPKVFAELAETGFSTTLTGILRETRAFDVLNLDDSLANYFDALYKHMLDCYRNEYIYKNAITKKLLLNRHSLKNSNIFAEFRIASSKADIMIVNGTSNIYEIKTDLDKLDRLNSQLKNYQKFSEFVSVVTSADQATLIENTVEPEIGIITLSPGFRLLTAREPASGLQHGKLSHDAIFDSLRRSEYTSILNGEFGDLPRLPNTLIHHEYRKIFRKIDIARAHKLVINVLKKRNDLKSRRSVINKFPESLKIIAATTELTNKKRLEILDKLGSKTKDSLAPHCH